MIKFAGQAALLALPVLLSACGGGGFEGAYVCKGMGLVDGIRLEAGGKATASANFGGNTIENSGTYRVQGNKVAVTIAGDTRTFTLTGGELRDESGGVCTRK